MASIRLTSEEVVLLNDFLEVAWNYNRHLLSEEVQELLAKIGKASS